MKVKQKVRKPKEAVTSTNGRGKKSKNVDLSTLSVGEFMSSAFDESGDSDIGGDDNADNLLDDTTRTMNGNQQERGVCLNIYL
jgi:hypothetical protein